MNQQPQSFGAAKKKVCLTWQQLVAVVVSMSLASFILAACIQDATISQLNETVFKLSADIQKMSDRHFAPEPTDGQTQIANPASTNCVERGGQTEIKTRPDGGQYGICVFPDGKQCEEWAMFRGDCPQGGVEISVVWVEAEIFCAISGGTPVRDANGGEVKICDLKGKACPSQTFFETGTCE